MLSKSELRQELMKFENYKEILENTRKMLSTLIQSTMTEYSDDKWHHQLLESAGVLDTCLRNLNKEIEKLQKEY